MKRVLIMITFITTFFSIQLVQAQDIQILTHRMTKYEPIGASDIVIYFEIVNVSADTQIVFEVRTIDNLPSGWSSSLCFGDLCFAPFIDSVATTPDFLTPAVAPGDTLESSLHVYPDPSAMLCCVLRRSRIDGAKQAAAVIKLLVKRLRLAWPETHVIVRGDSGFCRQLLIRWCERHHVSYVIGVARNARLHKVVADWEAELEADYLKTHCKQRMIREFRYAAESWKTERRLVTRLEFGSQGRNPRFVVSNLERPAAALYDDLYCLRGEAENRIKEVQLDLFGTRASCHTFLANWLRLLLAALAYTLMQRLRTIALAGTALTHAQAATMLRSRNRSRS